MVKSEEIKRTRDENLKEFRARFKTIKRYIKIDKSVLKELKNATKKERRNILIENATPTEKDFIQMINDDYGEILDEFERKIIYKDNKDLIEEIEVEEELEEEKKKQEKLEERLEVAEEKEKEKLAEKLEEQIEHQQKVIEKKEVKVEKVIEKNISVRESKRQKAYKKTKGKPYTKQEIYFIKSRKDMTNKELVEQFNRTFEPRTPSGITTKKYRIR